MTGSAAPQTQVPTRSEGQTVKSGPPLSARPDPKPVRFKYAGGYGQASGHWELSSYEKTYLVEDGIITLPAEPSADQETFLRRRGFERIK